MEGKNIKPFVGKDVEILVNGVWVEGRLSPIAEGLVVLVPVGEIAAFYGPTALKIEDVKAVRQIIKQQSVKPQAPEEKTHSGGVGEIKSALSPNSPSSRFLIADKETR
jgi:hypothetical protein